MTETTTTPKAKKASKPKAPKKPAEHPKYEEMIRAAIAALADRKGSSRQAIIKYIIEHYTVDNPAVHVKMALKRGVGAGRFVQVKGTGASGSFKVAKAAKPEAPKKPKVVKKETCSQENNNEKSWRGEKKEN